MRGKKVQMKRKSRKQRRNENGILFGSIILCIVTLCAVTICLVMVFQYRAAQIEAAEMRDEIARLQENYTPEEVETMIASEKENAALQASEETEDAMLDRMKELMLSGEGAVNMLRKFFPNEIVLVDNTQYYFFPISDTLAKHSYLPENFILTEDELIEYYDNGELVSHKGIDVSRYQEKIDWQEVAEDDVEYAFIRLGIRGYTEGEIKEDDTFEYNINGALDNGIEAGVYFFTQAISVEEAEEEAQYVLDAIEPYDVTYPVVLDVEAVSSENARTAELTKEEFKYSDEEKDEEELSNSSAPMKTRSKSTPRRKSDSLMKTRSQVSKQETKKETLHRVKDEKETKSKLSKPIKKLKTEKVFRHM